MRHLALINEKQATFYSFEYWFQKYKLWKMQMCSKIYGDFSRVLRYLQNKTRQPNFLGRPTIEHFKLVHLASLGVKIPSGSGFYNQIKKKILEKNNNLGGGVVRRGISIRRMS